MKRRFRLVLRRGARAGLAVPLLLAFSACASVSRDAGFSSVREAVARRSGYDVVWEEVAGAAAVKERVSALLAEGPLTADRAVEIALMNNRGLQATLAELGIARADLVEAGLLQNPVFSAELRFPAAVFRPFELTILQSFLDLLERPMRKRVAEASLEAARLRVGSAAIALVAQTRAAYYSLQAAQISQGLLGELRDSLTAGAELARRQREKGNSTALELERQQEGLDRAQIALSRSEAEAVSSREALNRLLGVSGGETGWTIEKDLPEVGEETTPLEGLEELALSSRLDVAAANFEVQTAASARPLRRLEKLGDLRIGAHRERDAQGTTTTGPAVEVSLPLFNRGQGATLRALSVLRQKQDLLAELTLDARSEVRQAHARLLSSRALVSYYRDSVLPRKWRIVSETERHVNAMQAGPYDLLDARRSALEAEREAVEARRDYFLARTELERAVGGQLVPTGGSK